MKLERSNLKDQMKHMIYFSDYCKWPSNLFAGYGHPLIVLSSLPHQIGELMMKPARYKCIRIWVPDKRSNANKRIRLGKADGISPTVAPIMMVRDKFLTR